MKKNITCGKFTLIPTERCNGLYFCDAKRYPLDYNPIFIFVRCLSTPGEINKIKNTGVYIVESLTEAEMVLSFFQNTI